MSIEFTGYAQNTSIKGYYIRNETERTIAKFSEHKDKAFVQVSCHAVSRFISTPCKPTLTLTETNIYTLSDSTIKFIFRAMVIVP